MTELFAAPHKQMPLYQSQSAPELRHISPQPAGAASAAAARAQVWLGYQQSLRPCETGLTLNVDLAATAFLQPQARPCSKRPPRLHLLRRMRGAEAGGQLCQQRACAVVHMAL
jgi:hypothetical protein